jgi:RimJ/RimL family protein N-acetyltransferase
MPPTVTLTTTRLLLRPPTADDAGRAYEMLTDPAVRQWNSATSVIDVDSARKWCERLGDWSNLLHATFTIADKGDGRLLGNVSIHNLDPPQRLAEIGYRLHPDARGHGFATEAMVAATDWAWAALGLDRLQLFHAVDNPASCAVATRAGYALEGVLVLSTLYGDGRRYDDHLHARLSPQLSASSTR